MWPTKKTGPILVSSQPHCVLNFDEKLEQCNVENICSDKQEDKDKCLEIGMDDFVSKPIKREIIEDMVKRWFQKKGATEEFCDACFTGDYPIPLADCDGEKSQRQLSLLDDRG